MELIANQPVKVSVISVTDGDTLLLNYQGENFSSRARFIDCPETQKKNLSSQDPQILTHWKYGELAKEFTKNLVTGKSLLVIPIEKDIYGRWVCDWYLGTMTHPKNVQLQLCKAGLCTHFLPLQQYQFDSDRELNLVIAIFKACAIACKNKLGFWQEPDFILPSNFKKINLTGSSKS